MVLTLLKNKKLYGILIIGILILSVLLYIKHLKQINSNTLIEFKTAQIEAEKVIADRDKFNKELVSVQFQLESLYKNIKIKESIIQKQREDIRQFERTKTELDLFIKDSKDTNHEIQEFLSCTMPDILFDRLQDNRN